MLGQLHEEKDNNSGACAAYQRVLDRWGKAKPASVRATKAK